MKRIKTLIGVMWLRNISYQGVGENPSQIKGLDENRMVQGVTFENVVINGGRMRDLKDMECNEFIQGIVAG